jgi:hypothetical protein
MISEGDWKGRIWQRKGAVLKREFPGIARGGGVRPPVFSPDSSALYLGGERRIRRYLVDAPLGDTTAKDYWLPTDASTVAFDREGTVMLGAGRDGFTLWDCRTDEVVLRGTTPGSGIFAAVGPHGRIAATHNGSQDTTHLWVVPQRAK